MNFGFESEILKIRNAIIRGESSARKEVEKSLARAKDAENLHALLEIFPEYSLQKADEIDKKIAEIRADFEINSGEILDENSEIFAKLEQEIIEKIGVLAGIPYIAKDNFLTKDGNSHTTAAAKILANFESPIDATAISKLNSAGAILIGKANLDAFAHGGSTENSAFGATKNAVNPAKVAGGSSGGSAVVVAKNVVPFALGSDTGGSIRQPASFNGVVGYKPTYGMISRYGVVAMASSTDVIAPITRTVADAEILCAILAGKDFRDSTLQEDYFEISDESLRGKIKFSEKISDEKNDKTVNSYEKYAENYILRDKNEYVKSEDWQSLQDWLKNSLEDLSKSAKIFEIGSGTGRDAEFLQNLGYKIQTSDATEKFIDELEAKKLNPQKFNILSDEFSEKYDAIIATAVLLHFDRENLPKIFAKIFNALNENGKFLVCVQVGEGSKWKNNLANGKRFFEFYSENDFAKMLKNVGFEDLEISYNNYQNSEKKWLQIVAKKVGKISAKKPKIGLIKEFIGEGVDPEIRARTLEFARELRAKNCEITEVNLPMTKYALAIYYIVVPAELSSNLARFDGIRYGIRAGKNENSADISGDKNRFATEDSEIYKSSKFDKNSRGNSENSENNFAENLTKSQISAKKLTLDEIYGNSRNIGFMAENKRRIMTGAFVLSSGYFDAYYLQAQKARTLLIREFDKLFEDFDFLIGPVAPTTAFGLGENTKDPLKMYLADAMTVPASLAGLPAISLPFAKSSENLPIGIQIIAPQKKDAELLEFAKNCENLEEKI